MQEKRPKKKRKEENKNNKDGKEKVDDSHLLKAEDFTVFNDKGEEVTLSSFQGKPVVVHFWASYAVPSKENIPYFKTAKDKYGENLEILMVNMTDGVKETKERAKSFAETAGISDMNIAYDINKEILKKYQIPGFPATVFVNENGKVFKNHIGFINEDELNKTIDDLLGIEPETETEDASKEESTDEKSKDDEKEKE